tara:strand:+ start:490 stop:771 length:282 start_codon:yes stop_codon:yes gene_type:complete
MIEASTMEFGDKKMANFTITNGKKELSLTVDNGSMGAQAAMTRADIRCFSDGEDVTGKVFGVMDHDAVRAEVFTMAKAMNWLQLSSDPYKVGG